MLRQENKDAPLIQRCLIESEILAETCLNYDAHKLLGVPESKVEASLFALMISFCQDMNYET